MPRGATPAHRGLSRQLDGDQLRRLNEARSAAAHLRERGLDPGAVPGPGRRRRLRGQGREEKRRALAAQGERGDDRENQGQRGHHPQDQANAVANAKIKDGAVESEKIADGSVTFDGLDSTTMPFSRVVRKARGGSPLAITEAPTTFPLSEATYTQAANENDSFSAPSTSPSRPPAKPRATSPPICSSTPSTRLNSRSSDVVAFGYTRDEPAPVRSAGGSSSAPARIRAAPAPSRPRRGSNPARPRTTHSASSWSGSCSPGTGVTATLRRRRRDRDQVACERNHEVASASTSPTRT